MAFLPGLVKVVKKVGGPLATIASFIPGGGIIAGGLKMAGKALSSPAGRAAVGVAGLGAGVAALGGFSGAGVGGLPALPGGGGVPVPSAFPSVGTLPAWRGPGGKLQWPWQDPRTAEALKPFALDDAYLRVCYRAPKGYVVVRDASGKPYPVMKWAARRFGLWKPKSKPPISAGDWHKYQTALRVEKKLVKIARHALAKHHRGTRPVGHCKTLPFVHHRKAA